MSMTSTDAWIGGALRRVTNAVTIAERHGGRSSDLQESTQANLAEAIREALRHGFSSEAVSAAAKLTQEEVAAIADGSAAA